MNISIGQIIAGSTFVNANLHLFHVSRSELHPGETLNSADYMSRPHYSFFVPDPPAEYMEVEDYRARRSVESIFEQIRHTTFTHLPSRETSLFASLSLEDAKSWQSKLSRNDGKIYILTPLAQTELLVVDVVFFNYAVRVAKSLIPHGQWISSGDQEAQLAWAARQYWSGLAGNAQNNSSRLEVLISGTVRITDVRI